MAFYRFIADGRGIYEIVERDCPRNDQRRIGKPDGSWLPRVGPKYPGAVSFWTDFGIGKYVESGLQGWHCQVINANAEVIIARSLTCLLYSDEFQVICMPSDIEISKKISAGIFMQERNALKIRRGVLSDALPVANVNVASWKRAYAGIMPDELLISLDPVVRAKKSIDTGFPSYPDGKGFTFVADRAAQIVGYAQGGIAREGLPADGEIYAIYADPGYIGAGIGDRLFQAAIAELRTIGFRRFGVWVLEDNHLARKFYLREGGQLDEHKKQKEFGGKLLTEVCYTWPLQEE